MISITQDLKFKQAVVDARRVLDVFVSEEYPPDVAALQKRFEYRGARIRVPQFDNAQINIHPRSGWFFIFGYNPKLYWRGTSALVLTCQSCICYLPTRKRVPWVKHA